MDEWTRDEIRRVGYQVVDLIADHLAGIRNRPVFQPVPEDLAQQFLSTAAPADGAAADAILLEFRETIEPYPFGNGHPRFWGWVNSPPAVMGIFADALAAVDRVFKLVQTRVAAKDRQVGQSTTDMAKEVEALRGSQSGGGTAPPAGGVTLDAIDAEIARRKGGR